MLGFEGKRLESERLCYRLLQYGDREKLMRILSDPDVTRPAGFMPPASAFAEDKFWNALTEYDTAVAVLRGDEIIGYLHVNPYRMGGEFEGKSCVSVGFVIGRAYQRHGYGREMLSFLSAYLRRRFDCVFGDCFDDNTPSRKTLISCGYRFVEGYTMFFHVLCVEKKLICFVFDK